MSDEKAMWLQSGGGSSKHYRASSELRPPLKLAWKHKVGDYIHDAPLVCGGNVYVGASDCSYRSLKTQTGEVNWRCQIEPFKEQWKTIEIGNYPIPRASCIAGQNWVIGSNLGYFQCLDLQSGHCRWQVRMGTGCPPIMVSAGDSVVTGASNNPPLKGALFSLALEDGQVRWRRDFGERTEQLAFDRGIGVVAAGTTQSHVIGFDLETGTERWSSQIAGFLAGGCLICDDVVVLGARNEGVFGLSLDSGEHLWCLPNQFVFAPLACSDGILYIAAHKLCAYELATRRMLWQTGGLYDTSAPMISGDYIYIGGGHAPRIDCRSRETGELLWSYETGDLVFSTPTIVDGRMFVGCHDGYLYCFESDQGESTPGAAKAGSSAKSEILSRSVCADDTASLVSRPSKPVTRTVSWSGGSQMTDTPATPSSPVMKDRLWSVGMMALLRRTWCQVRLAWNKLSPTADAGQAHEGGHQEASSLPNHGDKWVNSIGTELVYLDPARVAPEGFLIGRSWMKAGAYAEIRCKARLTKPFWLAAMQVTRGQFRQFVSETGYKRPEDHYPPLHEWYAPGITQTDEHPVVNVNWYAAKAFCEWLSRKEGKRYRLPTSAEWEFACRAGTTTEYNCGDTISTDQANYSGGGRAKDGRKNTFRGSTTPVGTFTPNAWGFFDMQGNVSEWCLDVYVEHKDQMEVTDPIGPADGPQRVVRGGSWASSDTFCRSSRHDGQYVDVSGETLGFRVAMNPSPGAR